jgi:hypothetical protein
VVLQHGRVERQADESRHQQPHTSPAQPVVHVLNRILASDVIAGEPSMRSYFPSAIALMVLASSQLGSAGEPSQEAMERFTRAFLAARRDELEARARGGSVRDCHGDLRAEHVIVPEDGEIYVYDCIEFNPELRQIDVAADFAFLLHGFHYLKDEGVMAIILPHGVLFRGGKEAAIRRKLLDDGHIDTVIGLPANLFYSTGIPVCILVLKKCKKPDDVLFINASGPEHFDKGKRQNQLSKDHIDKIVDTYQQRPEKIERYARRVTMAEIEENDYNLNISRYVSTAEPEPQIDLSATYKQLVEILDLCKQKESQFIAQKYIENSLIVKKRKFDIRQWVLVTDWNPLTVWLYQEPYFRFPACDYNPNNIADRFIHLTNNSIAKYAESVTVTH